MYSIRKYKQCYEAICQSELNIRLSVLNMSKWIALNFVRFPTLILYYSYSALTTNLSFTIGKRQFNYMSGILK